MICPQGMAHFPQGDDLTTAAGAELEMPNVWQRMGNDEHLGPRRGMCREIIARQGASIASYTGRGNRATLPRSKQTELTEAKRCLLCPRQISECLPRAVASITYGGHKPVSTDLRQASNATRMVAPRASVAD